MPKRTQFRFVIFALAALSLLTALWAGMVRLGWDLPALGEGLPPSHGPLMVVGFLGTLIGLERAAALGRVWPYGAPLLSGLAALSALAGLPAQASAGLAIAASIFLIGVFVSLHRQSPSTPFVIMGLSGAAWLGGNCLWLVGFPLYSATLWWACFLVLMIAGERLELSRIVRPPRQIRLLFYGSVALVWIGLGLSLLEFRAGVGVTGTGLMALAFWLVRYDMVWRTIHQPGLPRFMATCLLSGYLWLALGGFFWLLFAQFFAAGPRYDAMLHSIFLGFVFSMIFAHAPIILPSITGLALPFANHFYLHWALLHLSLALRIVGDIMLCIPGQKWGGLLNAAAVLLFLINNVCAVKTGLRETKNLAKDI